MKFLVPIAALLLLTLETGADGGPFGRWRANRCYGQCPGGSCYLPQYVQPPPVYWPPQPVVYQKPEAAKVLNRPADTKKPCDCPSCDCNSCGCDKKPVGAKDERNYGVDRSKISKLDLYTACGKQISRQDAFAILAKDRLTDDTNKWHLTVISTDPTKRKKVVDDWSSAKELQPYTQLVHLRDYDPSTNVNKLILQPMQLDKDEKFRKADFMLCLQPPADGSGQARCYVAYDYPGPSELAQLFQLRKVDPNYDPNKNPPLTPKGPDVAPKPDSKPETSLPFAVLVAGAAAVGTVLVRRSLGD